MQAPAADGSGGEGSPGADHLLSRPGLLEALLDGYSSPAIALNCGAILRDAARDERVAELLLASSSGPSSPSGADTGASAGGREGAAAAAAAAPRPSRSLFDRLLSAVDAANFEVASDAFASLRDLLTRHRRVVAARLDSAPDAIFGALASLTSSSNYVSRRQGVRLLGEILLERANARAMLRYVSDPDNLKAAMVLLKDPSRSIQFEAFHVFKVFVVNPNKLPAICVILASNRDKLLAHLADFQVDREDEQFREEKAVVVREISLLGGGGGGGARGRAPGTRSSEGSLLLFFDASASSRVALRLYNTPWVSGWGVGGEREKKTFAVLLEKKRKTIFGKKRRWPRAVALPRSSLVSFYTSSRE